MWRWERGDLIAVEFCCLRCRMHFAMQYACNSFVTWRDGFLDFAYTGFSCIDVFGYARRVSFDALCHSVDACLPAFQFNLRLHVNCTRWKWQRVKSFEIPFCSNRHASMSVENSKSYPLHDVSFRLGVDLPFVTRERAARNQCFGALHMISFEHGETIRKRRHVYPWIKQQSAICLWFVCNFLCTSMVHSYSFYAEMWYVERGNSYTEGTRE